MWTSVSPWSAAQSAAGYITSKPSDGGGGGATLMLTEGGDGEVDVGATPMETEGGEQGEAPT
jgi:hypothetical protein